jgi:hypothetical protein
MLRKEIPSDAFHPAIYTGTVETWEEGDSRIADEFKLAKRAIPSLAAGALRKRAIDLSRKLTTRLQQGDKVGRMRMGTTLADGLRESESFEQLQTRIEKQFNEIMAWNAKEIANSEVPRAYTEGQIHAAKEGGIDEVRIDLGPNACEWCITHAPYVETLADAEKYFADHHPNVECSLVILKKE